MPRLSIFFFLLRIESSISRELSLWTTGYRRIHPHLPWSHTPFLPLMATLSSSGSGSTLGYLQSNNTGTLSSGSHSSSTIAFQQPNAVSSAADLARGNRANLKGGSRDPTAVGHDASRDGGEKHSVVARDTKSLDYIARTMLAGGIAGITVSRSDSRHPDEE